MARRKDGMPKAVPTTELKVNVNNYRLSLNNTSVTGSIMTPRTYTREETAQAMADVLIRDLTKLIRQTYGV